MKRRPLCNRALALGAALCLVALSVVAPAAANPAVIPMRSGSATLGGFGVRSKSGAAWADAAKTAGLSSRFLSRSSSRSL